MNQRIRRLIGWTLSFVFVMGAGVSGSEEGAYKTKNVIVAVMDGVRFCDTFGDTERTLIPNLAAMEKEGTLFVNFRIIGPGISVTRQGHSTISTGTWQQVQNGGARMTMPTFFEYARNELGWVEKDCWAIFGKGTYSYPRYSSFPTYGQKFIPSFVIGIGEGNLEDDSKVLGRVVEVMDAAKPHLIFINFGVTDHAGHAPLPDPSRTTKPEVRSPEHLEDYRRAIRNCDQMFGKIWEKVQSTPGYKDATTVFYLNDHGRHSEGTKDGFVGHGDQCEGCRHIMLFAIGPDIKRGAVIDKEVHQIDVCPTVGELLGFQTPLSEGEVLIDCLVQPKNVNKKLAKTPEAQRGFEMKKMNERDIVKVLADANLLRDPKSLSPSPEVEIIMRGMLGAAQINKEKKYSDFVTAWAEKYFKEGATNPRVARILVELAGTDVNKEKYLAAARACAERCAGTTGQSIENSLNAGFLARLAQVSGEASFRETAKVMLGLEGKTEEELLKAWRTLKLNPPPMACDLPKDATSRVTIEDAMQFLALADVASAARSDTIVRLACDLQESVCSKGLREYGGVWDDPILSALILRNVALQRQLRKGKPQMKWYKPDNTKKGDARFTPKWAFPNQHFTKEAIPFAVNLLKYSVDEKGHFGPGTVMSDGAALLLFSQASERAAEVGIVAW